MKIDWSPVSHSIMFKTVYIFILAASATSGASRQNRVYVRFMLLFFVIYCLLYIHVFFNFKDDMVFYY
jgi:hypothetical protein